MQKIKLRAQSSDHILNIQRGDVFTGTNKSPNYLVNIGGVSVLVPQEIFEEINMKTKIATNNQ